MKINLKNNIAFFVLSLFLITLITLIFGIEFKYASPFYIMAILILLIDDIDFDNDLKLKPIKIEDDK